MNDIKPGDYARVKKTGKIFQVEDVNDNPNRVEDDEIYIEGSNAYGSVTIDEPDEIEKIDWSPPTPEDLSRALSSALHEWVDDIQVHETAQEGDGLISVLARWKGMEGGFHVRFGTWQEDML